MEKKEIKTRKQVLREKARASTQKFNLEFRKLLYYRFQ